MDQLKTMDTFVHIARMGSLAKAARQLSLSPAVISKHLQQLEEHLGAQLVNRSTRKISLTEIGQQYYEFAEKILAEVREEDSAVSHVQKQVRGTLRLIASPSFGNLQLSGIVAAFIRAYPKIQVSLTLTAYDLMELDGRNFDLAVYVAPQVPDTSMIGRKVGEVKWIVCAAPSYLVKRGYPDTPSDLVHHDCLLLRSAAGNAHWLFNSKNKRQRRVTEVKVMGPLVTNSVLSAKASVLAGAGISLLPMYCIDDELETGKIVELLPSYDVQSRGIYVVYRHGRYLPGKVRVFINFFAAQLNRAH